tara:strand:+ start:863 stop:1618 length:756 start_codon:yes stop_codon:yes gene_type:complete
MIVVDIGNTNIVIGFFLNSKLIDVFRFETKSNKSFSKIKEKINSNYIKKIKLTKNNCIISSVVPEVEKKIINFFKKMQFKVLKITSSNTSYYLNYNIDNPKELGADRIANCIAAINKYGKNCLILDFGTATTFDIIKNNTYQGGIISPGINLSHESLVKNASKLKSIKISKTNKVVGKNTIKAMQSGFFWGYSSLINGIINRSIIEEKFHPKIILTGGLAKVFKNQINYKFTYEPNLTLNGLYFIGLKKYA